MITAMEQKQEQEQQHAQLVNWIDSSKSIQLILMQAGRDLAGALVLGHVAKLALKLAKCLSSLALWSSLLVLISSTRDQVVDSA